MFNDQANPFWPNGPTPGLFYQFPGGGAPKGEAALPVEYTTVGPHGTKHAFHPITTGSSVIGLKYDEGVMIAADTLVSYGSLARYQNTERVFKFNEKTIFGVGGDFSDFQFLKRDIDEKILTDQCYNDNLVIRPSGLYTLLMRRMYSRRGQMAPLFVDLIVGGINSNETTFLGQIDLRGNSFMEDAVATSFGRYMALPIIRESKPVDRMYNYEEALDVIRKSMEILYYRDTRGCPTYLIAHATKDKSEILGPFNVNESWELATMVQGY